MPTVHDVAAAILESHGAPMTAMKLQKLTYYAKAWHAVWDDEELFPEQFEAWRNGPVCRALYDRHRGRFTVSDWRGGDPSALTDSQRETVDAIVGSYGPMSAQQLSELTHREDPWRDARAGLGDMERSAREIDLASMVEFYGALEESSDAEPF